MNLKEFAEKMNAKAEERDAFYNGCVNEVAGRILAKVKKKTPVGDGVFEAVRQPDGRYAAKKIASGGTLRRGWQVVPSERVGRHYEAKVTNNVTYASYVEHGHRQKVGLFVPVLGKRLKRSWVPGKHMLQKSHDEVKKNIKGIVKKRFRAYMERGLDD